MTTQQNLTRTQKRLVTDLDKIMSAAGLDYWNILDRSPGYASYRTTALQVITREIVRGEVVSQYTLIDEQLGSKICAYMFNSKEFEKLWHTKKFERFNYFILEKMSLMEKLALVKDVYSVSKAVAADIENVNSVRNALAHAFFPENLRAYRKKQGSANRKFTGPRYKGVNIFTFDGFERFLDDSRRALEFLSVSSRRKLRKTRPSPEGSSFRLTV